MLLLLNPDISKSRQNTLEKNSESAVYMTNSRKLQVFDYFYQDIFEMNNNAAKILEEFEMGVDRLSPRAQREVVNCMAAMSNLVGHSLQRDYLSHCADPEKQYPGAGKMGAEQ